MDKALTEGAAGVFGEGKDQKARNDTALIVRLYQEIGRLNVKRDSMAERSNPRAGPETWMFPQVMVHLG